MKITSVLKPKMSLVLIIFVFLAGCATSNPGEGIHADDLAPVGPSGENPVNDEGSQGTNPAPNPAATYSETFSGAEGAPWPNPWQIAENSPVTTAELQGGRARLQGPNQVVARMVQPQLNFLNCDATFTVEFENFSGQGCGFYCRQNGGYLTQSDPHGQGYAVFLEGNSGSLTLWYERDGDEIQHEIVPVNTILANPLQDDIPYRVRMQVEQVSSTQTQQRAKLWPAGEDEPAEWHVVADTVPLFGEPPDNPLTIPELQNVTGGLAVDIYNYSGTGSIFISDLTVSEIP